jgi:hypothetical protein
MYKEEEDYWNKQTATSSYGLPGRKARRILGVIFLSRTNLASLFTYVLMNDSQGLLTRHL